MSYFEKETAPVPFHALDNPLVQGMHAEGRKLLQADGVHTMLDLSTAHMPNTSPNFGPARHVEHEYGYVVWVTGEKGEMPDVPGWLVEPMVYAIHHKCMLINFDRDADVVDSLMCWEW